MLAKYFYTIYSLKPVQIYFQMKYRLRRYWRKATGFKYRLSIPTDGHNLIMNDWICKPISMNRSTFCFLNLELEFDKGKINWRENKYGKLWNYNLNYMDYLLQPVLQKVEGLELIHQFIQGLASNEGGVEPYPISLRGINWIKFISKHKINDTKLNDSLFAQYQILSDNLEYHILGNHLLENGFSLLFGAFYYKDNHLYQRAFKILTHELNEQILADGGHFELSPMYHQIILDRLLDCINLLKNNQRFGNQQQLLELIQEKAERMLNWLTTITFSNGEIPLLNDATSGIAPTTQQLSQYALTLNVKSSTLKLKLSASGYRKFTSPFYECIIDIGQIGPAYQPGHAHADTFNFVLNISGKPFIVDTGISTYDAGEVRLKERGTAVHNTVALEGINSSEVWSSFRVARRAKVKIERETANHLLASHNGYRKYGANHIREWKFSVSEIHIIDTLEGKIKNGIAYLHLAPGIDAVINNEVIVFENVRIYLKGVANIELKKMDIPYGYNKFLSHQVIQVYFNKSLSTTISIQS
jgi:hypothetical protein